MTYTILIVSLMGLLHLGHSLRLVPNVTMIQQGDPLLTNVTMRFGLLRPSYYPYGSTSFSPASGILSIFVRKPGGLEFEVVRTSDYAIMNVEAMRGRPEPYGRADAAFVWLVASHAEEPPASKLLLTNPLKMPDKPLFNELGEYQIRARVTLSDADHKFYHLDSGPVMVRVRPRPAVSRESARAAWPILYRHLIAGGYVVQAANDRAVLRAALPALGESEAASAVHQVLALTKLRESQPGESRKDALTVCNRLRLTLSPVGKPAFDLEYAAILLELREYELGSEVWRETPHGPRRLTVGLDYGSKLTPKPSK